MNTIKNSTQIMPDKKEIKYILNKKPKEWKAPKAKVIRVGDQILSREIDGKFIVFLEEINNSN